jgi:hypothetical protein
MPPGEARYQAFNISGDLNPALFGSLFAFRFPIYRPITGVEMRYFKTAALTLMLFCSSCEGHRQYYRDLEMCEAKDGVASNCELSSIQHRFYRVGEEASNLNFDYYLGFVEFDDQGWFWDRRQMDRLLDLLYGITETKDVLLMVYAHGWRHNADPCDDNVVCFQGVLERLDILEREYNPSNRRRTVVGVYIGWRGLSAKHSPFEIMSFWERKYTADRVGVGGVTELLLRLNDFRRHKNIDRDGQGTHMIISGHSFGAQLVYDSLSHSLLERAIHMKTSDTGEISYQMANSFADLVVLINPAFEGAKYESLNQAAIHRCYREGQRPIMLIISSKADQATGFWFPLGRRIANILERTRNSEQRDAINKAVGNVDHYVTHELRAVRNVSRAEDIDTTPCGCRYLSSTKAFYRGLKGRQSDEASFLAAVQAERSRARAVEFQYEGLVEHKIQSRVSEDLRANKVKYGDDIELARFSGTRLYTTNFPYLVVSTDENLISEHNDIWAHVVGFARRFYIRHIMNGIVFPADCFEESPPPGGIARNNVFHRSFTIPPPRDTITR